MGKLIPRGQFNYSQDNMDNSLFTVISSCLPLQNRINTGSICSKLVDILRDRNSQMVIRWQNCCSVKLKKNWEN